MYEFEMFFFLNEIQKFSGYKLVDDHIWRSLSTQSILDDLEKLCMKLKHV